MAAKKKAKQSASKKSTGSSGESAGAVSGIALFYPSNIRTFFNQVQAEFKKIVWPDKKVTIGLTGFVLILVFFFSLYLGTVDFFLGKLITSVIQ